MRVELLIIRTRHCACGYTWEFNKLQLIRLLFKDIWFQCPKCGQMHIYHMTWFCNEIQNIDVKKENKKIKERKLSVLRKG